MAEIVDLCAAAGTQVAEEQYQCFNARTAKRMDLVFSIGATEFLVDVTTIITHQIDVWSSPVILPRGGIGHCG